MKAAGARNTTKEALNCIRVLQRVLPVVFELESETSRFEMEVFWKREEVHAQPAASSTNADPQFVIDDETDDEEAAEAGISTKVPPPESKEKQYQPSLAEKLFTCLIDLMFCCGFTLPTKLQVDHYKINYTIWYSETCPRSLPVNSFFLQGERRRVDNRSRPEPAVRVQPNRSAAAPPRTSFEADIRSSRVALYLSFTVLAAVRPKDPQATRPHRAVLAHEHRHALATGWRRPPRGQYGGEAAVQPSRVQGRGSP